MIGQNVLIDANFKLLQSSSLTKTADNFLKTDNQQFKDVLTDTLSKASNYNKYEYSPRTSSNKPQSNDVKKGEDINDVSAEKKVGQTYKEAENTQKISEGSKTKAEKTDSPASSVKVSQEEKKANDNSSETTPEKTAAFMNTLSQLLGINPDELLKLLASADIKPEDLVGKSDAALLSIDKLSGILGMNANQKQTLADVVNLVNNFVAEEGNANSSNFPVPETTESSSFSDLILSKLKNISETKTGTENEVVQLENSNTTIVNLNQDTAKLEEMISKFRLKLQEIDEMNKQVQNNNSGELTGKVPKLPELTSDQIQKLNPSLQSNGNNGDQADKVAEVVGNSKEQLAITNEKGKESEGQSFTDSDNQPGANANSSVAIKSEITRTPETDPTLSKDILVQMNISADNQSQKINLTNTAEAAKLQKDVPVPKSEILNQVIEKAKVTLSGEKSEMVIDLKPDNLGKLALKVVTERGIVMAKFVAESQQVKETIQANMQLLKDTLEKQGLAVQGFSVSVNQEGRQNFRNNDQSTNDQKIPSGKISTNGINVTNVIGVLDKQTLNNPYSWNGSRFDFSA